MVWRLLLLAFALLSNWAPAPASAGSRGPLTAPAEPTVLRSGRDAQWLETGFDPILVFYPAGACETHVVDVELFSRDLEAWVPHPRHPQLVTGGCTVEDAGKLLNEIRIRCADPDGLRAASGWRVGVEVWRPLAIDSCTVDSADLRPLRVSILSPGPGDVVRAERGFTKLRGRIDAHFELPSGPRDDAAHAAALATHRPSIDRVRIDNLSTGEFSEDVTLGADGQFTGRAPVSSGRNHLRISVVSNDGRFGSAELEVEFSVPTERERVLAAERERMRRIRAEQRKDVELRVEPVSPATD